MTALAQKRFGYWLLVAAALLAAFAYVCSWQAGCYFDSKQGVGDIARSAPWSIAGLIAVALSWLAASLGAVLVAGPTVRRAVGSLLFFGVLLLPLGVLILLAGETSGIQACMP